MSSSTDELDPAVSLPDYSEDSDHLKHTPAAKNLKQTPGLTDEVQEEIDEMLENIPRLGKVFKVVNKIGSGTFSSVFVAKLKDHPEVKQHFALKHIIPTSHPSRIENELKYLQQLGGVNNVMGVKACVREKDRVVIVMPYFSHDKFQDYVQLLSLCEVREYMRNLLLALRRVHELDIIHRDVKPSNFLYNRKLKKYALVDFGLAQQAPVLLRGKTSLSGGGSAKQLTKQVTVTIGKEDKVTAEHRRPLSPRKTRSHNDDTQTAVSPRKRKVPVDGIENMPGSPQKKRLLDTVSPAVKTAANVGLTEIDMNSKDKQVLQLDKVQSMNNKNLTQPAPGLFKPDYPKSVKSPRRLVLTKRALDTQRKSLFEPGKPDMKRTTVVVEKNGKQMYKTLAPSACQCHGYAMICSICMSRSAQHAPRAGTPGFRSPEVLLRYPDQTTSVDIWSAGVIFLSLLSGRYPFFKANDDMTALAQIISIMGTEEVKAAAKSYGKNIICSPVMPLLNFKALCEKLRRPSCSQKPKSNDRQKENWMDIPDSAYDLLSKLLELNPVTRITADEALRHPFFDRDWTL